MRSKSWLVCLLVVAVLLAAAALAGCGSGRPTSPGMT
jgi:predicted small secreted protein